MEWWTGTWQTMATMATMETMAATARDSTWTSSRVRARTLIWTALWWDKWDSDNSPWACRTCRGWEITDSLVDPLWALVETRWAMDNKKATKIRTRIKIKIKMGTIVAKEIWWIWIICQEWEDTTSDSQEIKWWTTKIWLQNKFRWCNSKGCKAGTCPIIWTPMEIRAKSNSSF